MKADNQSIFRYLQSKVPDPLPMDHQKILKEISQIESTFGDQKSLNWEELSKRRLLASHTLGDNKREEWKQNLERWDEANQFVVQSIGGLVKIDFPIIQKVNQILTGSDGAVRENSVYGTGDEFIHFSFLPKGIELFHKEVLSSKSVNPILKAFSVYLWIVTLHPFTNGNGRTARLIADWVLMSNGHLPICFNTPTSSLVAQQLNRPLRDKTLSLLKFLRSLKHSYEIIIS